MDSEAGRSTVYAAVTAHLGDQEELVAECVMELIREPVDAATGLLALIQACGALAHFWAEAVGEDPLKVWATYAKTVAQVVGWSTPPSADVGRS